MLQFVTLNVATAPLYVVWYMYIKRNWCISGFYIGILVISLPDDIKAWAFFTSWKIAMHKTL
jgi:hypothetical protein